MKLLKDIQKHYQNLERLALGLLFVLASVGAGVAYRTGEFFVSILFFVIAFGTFVIFIYRIGLYLKNRQLSFREARKSRWILKQSSLLLLEWIFLLSILSVFYVEGIAVRKDWTEERLFSLSSRSHEILKTLNQPVTILLFDVPTEWNSLDELLKAYDKASDFINYEWVDMAQDQARVRTYDIRHEGTLVFFKNEEPNYLFKAFSEDLHPFGEQVRQSQSDNGETLLTRINNYEGVINETLLVLNQEQTSKTLHFFLNTTTAEILEDASGEGLSFLKHNIERLGYGVSSISLETLIKTQFSTDAFSLGKEDIVWLSESELLRLSSAEIDLLIAPQSALSIHLQNGGGLILSAAAKNTSSEIHSRRTRHLASWYRQFNVTAPTGIVVDIENFHPVLGQKLYESRGYSIADFPFINYADSHPITTTLKQVRLTPFLLNPQVIRVISNLNTPWQMTPLLQSGPRAWLEQNYTAEVTEAGNPRYHFGTDEEGQYPVAWAFSNQQTTSRVVFLGDDTFLQNDLMTLFGNRDFILNTILWSGGNNELLGSDYKVQSESLFLPSQSATFTFFVVFILGIPLFFTSMGIYRIYKRRKHS